jgi:hypothetical protein
VIGLAEMGPEAATEAETDELGHCTLLHTHALRFLAARMQELTGCRLV